MTNPTVRILAGRLRRALDRYYLDERDEDAIRIEIPKGSYVPLFSECVSERAEIAANEFARIPGQARRESRPLTVAVIDFVSLSGHEDNPVIAAGITAEVIVALTRFAELTVLGPFALVEDKRDRHRDLLHQQGARFALHGWTRTSGSRVRITTDLLDTSSGTSLWARRA